MEAIGKSEEPFRLLLAAIPHAVWVYDLETLRFLSFNEAALGQYGYPAEEFERLTVCDVHPPGEASRLRAALLSIQRGGPPRGPWTHVTRDGRALDAEVNARELIFENRRAVLAVVQDVTRRKALELELQRARRLEAVGRLAAGIAHEINTPIQFVGDNLRFIQDAFRDGNVVLEKYRRLHEAVLAGPIPAAVFEDLDSALRAADKDYLAEEIPKAITQSLDGLDRVATIVRAMKAFAHPGQKDKAPSDLNKALGNALIVARNELKYVADIETDFGDLPPVLCHLADLNQVFLNLLINAAQAIGEVVKKTGGKGRITVRTRRDGNQAVVSISDTGCGIPEAIRPRIFDPFFTTKEVGRGTGQGLSLARAIVVEKHGGRIVFEPNPPRGSTFVVYLPIGPVPASEEADLAAAERVA
jgi:PAS domain S-box-containing protein